MPQRTSKGKGWKVLPNTTVVMMVKHFRRQEVVLLPYVVLHSCVAVSSSSGRHHTRNRSISLHALLFRTSSSKQVAFSHFIPEGLAGLGWLTTTTSTPFSPSPAPNSDTRTACTVIQSQSDGEQLRVREGFVADRLLISNEESLLLLSVLP